MNQDENKLLWMQRINVYRSSGLSAKKWCEANQINFHALGYWTRKLKKENASAVDSNQWVSVEITDSEKELSKLNSSSTIKVQLGLAIIEIEPDFDTVTFKNVARILSELC